MPAAAAAGGAPTAWGAAPAGESRPGFSLVVTEHGAEGEERGRDDQGLSDRGVADRVRVGHGSVGAEIDFRGIGESVEVFGEPGFGEPGFEEPRSLRTLSGGDDDDTH
jgi:hypothetical protein